MSTIFSKIDTTSPRPVMAPETLSPEQIAYYVAEGRRLRAAAARRGLARLWRLLVPTAPAGQPAAPGGRP